MHAFSYITLLTVAAASTASALKLIDFESTPNSASTACATIYNTTIPSCSTYSSSTPCTTACQKSLSALSDSVKTACFSVLTDTAGILNQLQSSPLDKVLCPDTPTTTSTQAASELFSGVMTLVTSVIPSTVSELSLDPAVPTSDTVPGPGAWRNGLLIDVGPTPTAAVSDVIGGSGSIATGSSAASGLAVATAAAMEEGDAMPIQSEGGATSGRGRVTWGVLALAGVAAAVALLA
ncbi:hypothetical protein EDC01DRAFT_486216 [Geopyxis carbonaria]|nr:hypothetical protein EDC01DRAFT_486216 [Geopyxis carbonaria]